MEYIIGVDGGATKTEAGAYNMRHELMARGRSGFGNLFLDFQKAAHNIIQAVEICINDLTKYGSDMKCAGIYLGLAGIDVEDNKEKIEDLLKKTFSCEVYGFHDSYLAHAAIHKGQDGITVISGTGSVCCGIYNGKSAKSGGWGHIIGDEGSGYHIAISAFKKMAHYEDMGLPQSELSRCIMNKMKITDVNDIVDYTRSYSKAQIASFAAEIAGLAENGDKDSVDILKQAGQNLAQLAVKLHRKLNVENHINIGISGSILCKIDTVAEEFAKYLKYELPLTSVILKSVPPTQGACYLHKKLLKKL